MNPAAAMLTERVLLAVSLAHVVAGVLLAGLPLAPAVRGLAYRRR